MKKAIIDSTKCDQSPFCPVVRVCPIQAVSQEKMGMFKAKTPVIDPNICTGCGKCIGYCPHGAVKLITK